MAENAQKKGKMWIIIGIILILFIVIVFFVFGARSITKALLFLGELVLFAGTLFALAYLFYFLFIKKHKYDVTYVNYTKIVEAGTKLKRPMMKDLYVSGDKGHARALVGKIDGWCRIQVLTRNYLYEDKINEKGEVVKVLKTVENERGEKVPQYEVGSIEQDCFIIRQKGLLSLFQDPMVIRVNPEDHTPLVGDVTLFGFSIIPIGQFWFLNNDHLDVRKIDYAILKECERTVAFATLSDMKELIDKATSIDASHKKLIQAKSLVEIPETKTVGTPNSPYQ